MPGACVFFSAAFSNRDWMAPGRLGLGCVLGVCGEARRDCVEGASLDRKLAIPPDEDEGTSLNLLADR